MATFILVHGTFAKAAHWPALRDGLALAASAVGEHSQFVELKWSSKNRTSARQVAATELSSVVQDLQARSRNERIFIIGHSHGGSAIAYFLKEYSSLAKALSGCAFLSTPFVAIRPRAHPFLTFSVVCTLPFWAFGSFYLNAYGNWPGDEYSKAANLHPFALIGLALWAVLAALFMLTVRKLRNPAALLDEALRRQTAELPPGNYLFLRCSGDEAAAALSAAQFIVWLSMKFARILEAILGPVLSGTLEPGQRRRYWYGLLFSMFLIVGSMPPTVDLFRLLLTVAEGQFALWLLVSALFYCVLVAPILLALCGLAAFLIFVAQAVTSWSFGWTGLSTGFLVELAIEPIPFGAHSLVHIDWAADTTGLEGIVHSWTYAHPAAITHLQNWIRESLENTRP